MAIKATLCSITKNDKVLLLRAARGINKGKWIMPGGKITQGENSLQCAVREVMEETGLLVSNLTYHGLLNIHENMDNEIRYAIHLFSTITFSGKLRVDGTAGEVDEVRWHPIRALPFKEMWKDDAIWIPRMLNGEKFDAHFYLDKENKNVVSFEFTTSSLQVSGLRTEY